METQIILAERPVSPDARAESREDEFERLFEKAALIAAAMRAVREALELARLDWQALN